MKIYSGQSSSSCSDSGSSKKTDILSPGWEFDSGLTPLHYKKYNHYETLRMPQVE